MSDDAQPTYSAREIVLELFPATDERLVPTPRAYRLLPDPVGNLVLYTPAGEQLLTFTPVAIFGSAAAQLCCDFCTHSAPRYYLQPFRVEVPGTAGRRSLYVTLCRDTESCDLRRFDDRPVQALLERVYA